jgi:hypothetical protein
VDFNADGAGGKMNLFQEGLAERIRRVGQRGYTAYVGEGFADEVDAFSRQLGRRCGQACDIAARPRQAFDKTGSKRIAGWRHNDGYRRRRSFRGVHGRRLGSNNDIDLETNQFGGQFRETTELVIGRTKLNLEVLADDISEFAQPVIELARKRLSACGEQNAYCGLWLLRACSERPRCCADDQDDELAPLHTRLSRTETARRRARFQAAQRLLVRMYPRHVRAPVF